MLAATDKTSLGAATSEASPATLARPILIALLKALRSQLVCSVILFLCSKTLVGCNVAGGNPITLAEYALLHSLILLIILF